MRPGITQAVPERRAPAQVPALLPGLDGHRGPHPDTAEPGKVITQMNLSAPNAALHLMAGPLCVFEVVESLRWFFGWDTEALDPDVIAMLHTWGRIAGVPYPGPELSESVGH